MRNPTVDIDRYYKDQDVDAALYLLERILSLTSTEVEAKRVELTAMQDRIQKRRALLPADRSTIVGSYREAIG